MKWKQYTLHAGDRVTTGWLQLPLRRGQRVTLKHEPDIVWTVTKVWSYELDEPPERTWKVGGLGMIRIVDGKPIQVPDDERITPELKSLRTMLNELLHFMSTDSPRKREIDRRYREGMISEMNEFDWYTDPIKPDEKK